MVAREVLVIAFGFLFSFSLSRHKKPPVLLLASALQHVASASRVERLDHASTHVLSFELFLVVIFTFQHRHIGILQWHHNLGGKKCIDSRHTIRRIFKPILPYRWIDSSERL